MDTTMKFCANCGVQNSSGSKFCASCGTRLELLVEESPAQGNEPLPTAQFGEQVEPQQPQGSFTQSDSWQDQSGYAQSDSWQSQAGYAQSDSWQSQAGYAQSDSWQGQAGFAQSDSWQSQAGYTQPDYSFRAKTRQEIKAIAKDGMKAQYGVAVAAPLIVGAIAFVGGLFGYIPILGLLVVYGTLFFLDFPLVVNMSGMFIKVFKREQTSVGELFNQFEVNYLRKVGGMAWMYLFTVLWMLLFIVPGIIKAIAYSMTQYILAECPNVSAKDALKLSMRMTNGYKGELFVFYLSYIGWMMLSSISFGIVGIFYTNPYLFTAHSGYYIELRDRALASGAVSVDELTTGNLRAV